MGLLSRLWRDDAGFIVSSELVLLGTVAVIGLTAGVTTIRDQVVQEMADFGDAFSELNQSFSFSGVVSHSASTGGAFFVDQADFCEAPGTSSDQRVGNTPQCLQIAGVIGGQESGLGPGVIILP